MCAGIAPGTDIKDVKLNLAIISERSVHYSREP